MPIQLVHKQISHGNGQQSPSRIIIHAMGEFIYIDIRSAQSLDMPPGEYHAYEFLELRRLSAHILGTPSGVKIRCREDNQGAWHAKGYNANSLSYEYLVPGLHDYTSFLSAIKTPYVTDAAYQAGVEQILEWKARYGIDRIDRHSDVDPTRKYDPGDGFPWEKLLEDTQ